MSALGEAGIKLLEYVAPHAVTPAEANQKKLSKKARKAQEAAEQAAKVAREEWLAKENAELARLAQPPRRGNGGGAPTASADVRMAAFRPVKVLADALGHE